MPNRKYFRKGPSQNRHRRFKRRLILETLEDRRLLNVDWRNPVDSMDVDNDGAVSPLDVLVDINYINSTGSGGLPARRDPSLPFLDVDGDQSVSPLDVLNVINYLNSNGSGQRGLRELAGQLVAETDVTITLGQFAGARNYRVRIDTQFDTSDRSASLEDLLAVYLVDPLHPIVTLLDRGTNGTALFTLAGSKTEFIPGRVRWDGSVLDIDLSDLAARQTGLLKFQLLNNDRDSLTKITISPLTNQVDTEGSVGPMFPLDGLPFDAGPALTLASLAPVASSKLQVSNVRFDSSTGRYTAEVSLRNDSDALGREVAAVFPGLPAGVTLRNRSGTTVAGEPYLNLKPAIQRGGLGRNSWSEPVSVEFDNPGRLPIVLKPIILANANHAPTLAPIAPLTVLPGGILTVALGATDQDGDRLSYSFRSVIALPNSILRDDGLLEFRPELSQIGRYNFDVVVNDGSMEANRSVTLDVVADPVTTTRISGKILRIDGLPLANMQVEIGSVQGLTQNDGSFSLDLGNGALVSDTLKVRGELFAGPLSYPFIGEKLHLLLDRSVVSNANNVIRRPIYLPSLDTANAVTIDPARDTAVTTSAIPGAEVLIRSGTLMTQQGTPYTGKLSITEVPIALTPAALPAGVFPDLVVTIQPGEMVFASPAPLKLPNRSGRAPGSPMDLWAINPITGQFDKVGSMRVSADGQTIDTISGGIRYSSWDFAAEPTNQPDPGPNSNQGKTGCPEKKQACKFNSEVETYSGTVIESHELVTYQSQGEVRGLTLVYDSLRANPQPIVHFRYRNAEANSQMAAGIYIERGDYQKVYSQLSVTWGGTFAENFWSTPASGGTVDAALQLNMQDEVSGKFEYTLTSGFLNGILTSTASQVGTILNVNAIKSPFGAGWGLAGLQHLIENPDGSVLLVDGDGTELLFESGLVSPPGDFSLLIKNPDGSYTRTLKDQTRYAFDTSRRLTSVTDRNGNRTSYEYNAAGRLGRITDPVGLQTTFVYAGNQLVSITDPASRVTNFTHDAAGNLTQVLDPDNTSRSWKYDSNHLQVGEVDKRGLVEQTFFDFAGRAKRSIRKDGTEIKIAPAEVRGLYRDTSSEVNSPVAISIGEAQSQYVTANGNVVTSQLDRLGQVVSERDSVGTLPKVTRDARNLVESSKDARGNITLYKYHANGNLVSMTDSLSGDGALVGEIAQPGERHVFTFKGNAGEQILIDGRSEPDPLGRFALIKLTGPDGLTIVTSLATSDTSSIKLKMNGLYRIEVFFELSNDEAARHGIRGSYQFKLVNLSASPIAEYNKSIPMEVPALQLAAWQFDGVAGQRVTTTYIASLAMALFSPDNQRIQTPFGSSFTLPLTGKYIMTAGNSSSQTITSSFTIAATEPPASPLNGLDEVHAGTAAPGQILTFHFTGPAGLPVTYEQISSGNFFVGFQHLATGESLQLQGRVVPLPFSGEYSVILNNFGTEPFDFSFRILNMEAPIRRLEPGVSRNLSMQPSAQTFFSFQGTIGERVILNESPLESKITFLHGTTVEQNYYAGTQLPATGTYYVSLRNRATTTVDTTIVEFNIQALPLELDTAVTGKLPAEGAPHIYQFEGSVGQTLYFDDLGSTPGGAWVLNGPDNQAVASNTGFAFGNRLGDDNVGVLKATGTYYLLLSSRENNASVPAIARNYHFRLLNSTPTVRSLTLGQLVSGTIDRKNDADEYTFVGTAGQQLFFDGLTRSSSLKVDIISPSGVEMYRRGSVFGPGLGNDIAGITLLESGVYRIAVFGDYALNHFTGDYQFRLLDVTALPSLSIGGTTTGTISPQLVASATTFTGRRGQSLHFQWTGDPNTLSSVRLNLYGPEGQLSEIGNDSTKLLPSDGTYIVSNLYDQTEGQPPVEYSLQTTDVSDASIAPSGLSALFSGNIGATETKTYQFNAPAGLVVLFDNHSVEDVGLQAVITYPSIPTAVEVAVFGVGRDHPTPISLPRSGTYTITVRGNNATVSGSYEFRIVDILHDSIPVSLDSLVEGTFESNKKGSHVYRFVTAPGQAFYVDQTNNDWNYIVKSPEVVRQATQPTIAFAGTQYLIASRDNTSGLEYGFRVVDLESVPALVLGEAVEGVATPGRAVIYKIEAQTGDPIVYEIFNSQLVAVYDRSMGQIVSRSVQASEFVAKHAGTCWFIRDFDGIRDPFPFKLRVSKPDTITKPLNDSGGTNGEMRFTYDAQFNQLASVTDELGRQTLLDVDPTNGNVRKITQVVGDVGGSDDIYQSMTYTPSGQIDTLTDPLGRITDFDYDTLGRIIFVIAAKGLPLQTTRSFEYDAAGNISAIIDENSHRTEYLYDVLDRLKRITESDPDGAGPLTAPVSQYTYDPDGNLLTVTDPVGHVSSRTYDQAGRVATTLDPGNNVTRYDYDKAGNLILTTDPLGHATQNQFDARNRIVASIDPAGKKTFVAYDTDNNLRSVTDASDNKTRYEYDARSRTTKRIDPLGSVELYAYDATDNLNQRTDRLGRIVETSFDDLDRLTTEVWRNPDRSLANTVNYTYDLASNLVRIQDSVCDLHFTWDSLNRATQEKVSGPNGLPTSILDNTFDAVGNRLTVADTINGQAGGVNMYSYDALDRMTRIVQTGTGVANKRVDMQYNALGQMTTLARFADIAGVAPVAATIYAFDTLNRISGITHRNTANAVLDSFAYQYDAASRITRITDIDGPTDFQYDTRDQLTAAAHSDPTNLDETYAYDATGNRLSSQRHGAGYVVGDGVAGTADNNRLTSDGTYRYVYDAEGNLLTRTQIAGGAVREFAWDHRNRLTRITDRPSVGGQPTQVVEFTYDALNRRIAKKVDATPADAVDGTITYFVYDGSDVLVELFDADGSGPAPATKSMRYLHGPAVDQVLAQEDASGNVQWMLTDHLGTVHDLVNNSGAVVNHLKYDSYGNVISESNPSVKTRYRFTGREFDAETGLQYYRARYYDAAIGRFISEDPIGLSAGDVNMYRYVGNIPISATDPEGMKSNVTAAKDNAKKHYNYGKGLYDKGKQLLDTLFGHVDRAQDTWALQQQAEFARNQAQHRRDQFVERTNEVYCENPNIELARNGQQAIQVVTVPVQGKLQEFVDNSPLGKLGELKEKITGKYAEYQNWRKARSEKALAESRERIALKVKAQRRL